MASYAKVETEYYEILPEMVDNAGGASDHTCPPGAGPAEAMRELIRRLGIQYVPKFKMDEVVERVVAAKGTEIEDLLRQEIRSIMRGYYPDSMKPNGQGKQETDSDRRSSM
jgi:hypothetical protein